APSGNRVHVIWTHHHLIMDGWCVGILFDRLITCYATAGQPAGADVVDNRPGDTLNRDYFRWLASRDKMTSVNYWATLLSGVERPARLMPWPNSEGHAKRQQGAGYQLQRHDVNLSAEIKNALQTLGATRNATLSSVIRLVWGVLLARFTNAADVVYGTVVSGRPPEIAGIESAVGLFINTVPVRFTLDSDLTATAALTLIQDQANAGRDHEYLPLAEIQAAAPDLSAREPLFDHLIVLENYPMDAALRGSGSSSSTSSSTTGPANTFRISDIRAFERTDLPLNLVIVPTADGLDASFLFDASVYPAQQIEHLAEHFVHLAQTLTQFPEQTLVSLNMMTPDEQRWMSAHWNVQAPGYPAHQTLVDLYQSAVSQYGDRLAIQDDLGGVSYAVLHTRVQSAAAALLHHASYTPGQRVALWLPRNRDMIVAMLAVLSAGGSYVALDPIYPEERLQFIVQDSGAAVVLSSADMPGLTFNVPVVDIHQMTEAVTAQPDLLSVLSSGQSSVAGLPPSPGSAAYVIYTSGSTGQPKGCEISHRNVVQLLRNNRFDFDFDHNDVWVAAHSFCFDFSVWEMYGALLNGGMLVVPTAAQVRNVETFVDLVAQHKVTVLNQTPAAFYQFARVALKKADNQLSALRLVIFGGDSLACNRLAEWIAAFPVARVKLVNMYGITETTVHVSYREVTESDIVQPAQLNLVGRPLPQTGVWIVDRFGQLQPPGIAGEIVVSGSGVGMGYLNRPELSARKFAALDSAGQTHCYWSGDVGYIDPALGLVYLGRNDHQVQVRGYRVECEEIARCLESHQSVAEALVVPIENVHGTELVAYLTGDSTAAPAQWRPWLASRLPDYMIPACTRWLDAMPLTPNGKVDRAALPDPVSVVPAPTVDVPDTIESSIISVWKQVLGDAKIDPTTNFFDVGGHSLKALTLVDTLQSQFGYELSVADVFEFPTPRQQAAQCTVAHISHDSVVPGADPGSLDLNDLDLNDLDLDALEALLTDVSDNQGR
ncbi:MAG: amino acid adenylation domain-containing protein, partial [Gammaproteobacteria bacterium]|nr:amino acid adenylation domain-containing protein [Gammaproteobacteria bacterium]